VASRGNATHTSASDQRVCAGRGMWLTAGVGAGECVDGLQAKCFPRPRMMSMDAIYTQDAGVHVLGMLMRCSAGWLAGATGHSNGQSRGLEPNKRMKS
jgi:hypothetical protein